ncbi:hypothetical protein TcasGA2_TC004750 [Tribolium castaneum]|uniref:Uncharacterized protein n=1 Tax=Tribolium castaneum TaxID=7070 RepID=D6W7W7_TRICA|nr:hypothetical protein TcasGA2_TC004750 [Tribolium castaneum]
MAAPHGIAYVANKLVFDNCYRRSMLDKYEALQYLRDRRLSGDPYKLKGLENIPDA